MLRRLPVLLTIGFLLLLITAHLLAQSNEKIPECSKDQLATLSTTLKQFGTDFNRLNERMKSAKEPDLPKLIADLDDYQQKWWSEIVPSLPRCSVAVDMSLIVGRMIDEGLIAMALTRDSNTDKAQNHLKQITVLSEEFSNRINPSLPEPVLISTVVSNPAESATVKPRAGHWEGGGDGDAKETVSFTVTEQGIIDGIDFGVEVSGNGCRSIQFIKIPIAPNGSFSVSVPGLTFVEGQFDSETTVKGTYGEFITCNITLDIRSAEDRKWTAEWKRP